MYDFEYEHFFGQEPDTPRPRNEFFIDARGRARRREPQLTWRDILVGWAPTILVHGILFLALGFPSYPRGPSALLSLLSPTALCVLGAYFFLGPLSLLFTAAVSISQFPRTRTPGQTLATILGVSVGALGLMKLLPMWFAALNVGRARVW
jgi:hypothetical protein